MPNAHDYRAAADRFRRLAVELEDRPVDTASLAAGPVRTAFDDSMAAVVVHLGRGIDELRRLAVVCDQRADVCASYARAVWQYRQLDRIARLQTRPPTRPAPWVEL